MNGSCRVMGREEWVVALGRAGLSEQRRKGHEITIRWFFELVPSSRSRGGAEP